MKRIISMILALVLMLSLAACAGGNTETEPTETKMKTDVAEPLTWEKINALPIANDDMTEEELRQLVLDYVYLQLTFAYTPSHSITYNNASSDITLTPGMYYGGLPYDNGCYGNIYMLMEFYDEENGVLDLSGGGTTLGMLSNQCSSSMCWGWGRVANTLTNGGATDSTYVHGYLPVGPYTYEMPAANNGRFDDTYTSNMVCEQNGPEVMFESYAQLKPADGLINGAHNGHVRMVSTKPNVVLDANGKVDGMLSTLTFVDQGRAWWTSTQSNGVPYEVQGGVDVKVSFFDLYKGGYIPVTIAELNKQDPVEKSETTMDYTGDTVTVADLRKAKITSNYWMSDITITVKDEKGNEVYRSTMPVYYGIRAKTMEGEVSLVASSVLDEYADGKHTVEVSSRISTGEKPVVYTGTLVG